jgi:hypothetical protein
LLLLLIASTQPCKAKCSDIIKRFMVYFSLLYFSLHLLGCCRVASSATLASDTPLVLYARAVRVNNGRAPHQLLLIAKHLGPAQQKKNVIGMSLILAVDGEFFQFSIFLVTHLRAKSPVQALILPQTRPNDGARAVRVNNGESTMDERPPALLQPITTTWTLHSNSPHHAFFTFLMFSHQAHLTAQTAAHCLHSGRLL